MGKIAALIFLSAFTAFAQADFTLLAIEPRVAAAGGSTVIELALADRIGIVAVSSGDDTYSFGAWVRPIADSAAPAGLITDSAGASGVYYQGGAGGTHKINFLYSGMNHLSTTALTEGVWSHVAISVSGGTATFYLNGVSDGTCSSVPTITFDRIGTDAYGDDFNGRLAQMALYSIAISGTHAADLYSKATLPDTIGSLLAYWKLDDVADGASGNGATFVDSSGNGKTGTGVGTTGRTADF